MSSLIRLPKTIFLLGYGAVGKCFTELLFSNFRNANLIVLDKHRLLVPDNRFTFIEKTITKDNINELNTYLNAGDIMIDLSCDIDVMKTWELCIKKGVNYLNTSMENWEENDSLISYANDLDEMYNSTEGNRHDMVEKHELWNKDKGPTSLFEFGMNPGLVSHLTKKGLIDAANYFLTRIDWTDIDHISINKYLKQSNFPKLAQIMGLHTIHSTEQDCQYLDINPTNSKTKLYNTWSCRGLITEQMVPMQVARGSHEDEYSKDFPRIRNGTLISSWGPAYLHSAKSWNPFENIIGTIAPHGEAYSLHSFFSDKETGYAPSQYFVYDCNKYTKEFINNLSGIETVQTIDPEMEVLHNPENKLHGCNKVGSLLIFNKNRGWWCGSIMDEFDAALHMNHEFNPTVIQVAAGAYSGMIYMSQYPNDGNKWSEDIDTEFIIKHSSPYLGRLMSDYVDLRKTHIKDCYKFESFLCPSTYKRMKIKIL